MLKWRNVVDPEEDIERAPLCESLGIIGIAEGPTRWINVTRKRLGHILEYHLKYGVPDSRLGPSSPKVQLESAPKRKFLLYGKVFDLKWKGEDSGMGIISLLNSDGLLKQMVLKSRVNFKISAHGNQALWIISSDYDQFLSPPTKIPFLEEWHSCQTIANHLLAI